MVRSTRRLTSGILGVLIVSLVSGMLFSKLYWGYWISPPSVVPWVRDLQSAEGVVYVKCEPAKAVSVKAVTEADLGEGASAYRETPWDYPGYQLLAALQATRTPIPQDGPIASRVEQVCDRLFRSGVVLEGDPGYQYARFVRGFLVVGRTRSNEPTVIWSAIGGEVSNDHHPVYDLQFAGSGRLMRSHVYFEDVAGIEGLRWWVVSLLVFVVGVVFLVAAWVAISVMGFAARRLRKSAATADR